MTDAANCFQSQRGDSEVDQYITNCKAIKTFYRKYKFAPSNICFFYALSFHRTRNANMHRDAVRMFNRWCKYKHCVVTPSKFEGVTLEDIPELEHFFKINIRIYTIEKADVKMSEDMNTDNPPGPKFYSSCVVRPRGVFSDTVNLNLNANHFSYITNINAYINSWKCGYCDQFFAKASNYNRHVKNNACKKVKKVYPGGGFGLKKTVFQKLEAEGIKIPHDLRFFPYRAVYDFECRFQETDSTGGGKLKFTKILIPASFSVKSNVPGFDTPFNYISGDPKDLIEHFVDYLTEISESCHQLMLQKYEKYLNRVNNEVQRLNTYKSQVREETNEENRLKLKRLIYANSLWEEIDTKLRQWLQRLPVLGFNSGKFDLNLIKDYLIPHLLTTNDAEKIHPIKRNNNFMAISLENLQFLDICNYLAAGTSYDKWIKAFKIPQTKGMWPYEWFDSMDRLNETNLPDRDSFYSTLRQKEMTVKEYEEARHAWNSNGFQTMREMLVWYNNLDVSPFLEASEKMYQHFKGMNIDMFKQDAISLPGLAMNHMFQDISPENFFQLFGEETKEWQQKVKDNVVGGPSIIFHRYHQAGKTYIRDQKLVSSIQGYDANALYLSCTAKDMPTGLATTYTPIVDSYHKIPTTSHGSQEQVVRQIKENGQNRYRIQRTFGQGELNYVLWEFKKLQQNNPTEKMTLNHRFNGGQECVHVGEHKFFVDGFVPELQTVLQYHGCYFHGHDCMKGKMNEQLRLERQQKTEKTSRKLREAYKLIEEYECIFHSEIGNNKDLQQFVNDRKTWGKNNMSMDEILEGVKTEKLFGLVECDIQVDIEILTYVVRLLC